MAVVTALPGLRLWPLWFLAALQATCVYGAKLSSEACRELGFSSNLLCSSCNLLGQFSLSQLDPFCRDCCQEEAQLETRKHQKLCVKRDLVEYTYNVDFLAQLACLMDISDKLNAVIVTLQDSDTKHARENSMLVLFLKFVDENWEGSLKFREPYSVLVFPKNGSVIDFNGTYSKIKHNVSCFAFVRSDKPKLFRGLQIKYVRGSDPVLKLLDDSGNIAEELSILKWNTDSVEEFLSEKLERI